MNNFSCYLQLECTQICPNYLYIKKTCHRIIHKACQNFCQQILSENPNLAPHFSPTLKLCTNFWKWKRQMTLVQYLSNILHFINIHSLCSEVQYLEPQNFELFTLKNPKNTNKTNSSLSMVLDPHKFEKTQKIQIWNLSWLWNCCTHNFHWWCLKVAFLSLVATFRLLFKNPSTAQPPQIINNIMFRSKSKHKFQGDIFVQIWPMCKPSTSKWEEYNKYFAKLWDMSLSDGALRFRSRKPQLISFWYGFKTWHVLLGSSV